MAGRPRQVQQRDALVQPRNREVRIERRGILKFLQSLFEELLVHVGDAEIVEARGFRDWVRGRQRMYNAARTAAKNELKCVESSW